MAIRCSCSLWHLLSACHRLSVARLGALHVQVDHLAKQRRDISRISEMTVKQTVSVARRVYIHVLRKGMISLETREKRAAHPYLQGDKYSVVPNTSSSTQLYRVP